MNQYKVAAVQVAPEFLDLDAGIEKAIGLMKEASEAGAKLIAFPENFLPGYPWFVWLSSIAECMPLLAQYRTQGLVIGSDKYQKIEEAAAMYGIYVVLGFTERSNGSLYIAQALIDDHGKTFATRRKLKPTMLERVVFGEGDGSDLAVHDTPLGRVGALCCWEHAQPLLKAAMFSQHEQVHVASWPSFSMYKDVVQLSGPVNNALSRSYAVEGQCFVIAPCAIVSQSMVDLMCTTDTQRSLLKKGGGFTCIYGPDGSLLSEPLGEDEEGLVYADVNLALQDAAKIAADPVGHYSRSDVVRLHFNPKSHRGTHAWKHGAQWNEQSTEEES